MIATIKEVLICLKAGRVTLPYPFVPLAAPPRFRGRPAIDGAKCLGCGACAEVCPPRLITVSDQGETRRVTLIIRAALIARAVRRSARQAA